MCIPSTGNRYLDIGVAAAASAITAGAATPAFATSLGASAIGTVSATTAFTASSTALAATGGAIMGAATQAVLGPMFAQPEFPTYDTPYQTAQVQQFNSQQSTVTGSGGRQASASLAEAIQRSKQRKLTQEDVGDLSIDTSAFASTGLQLA